jgi:putative DNA-invertase from lambdoid prophage Rac
MIRGLPRKAAFQRCCYPGAVSVSETNCEIVTVYLYINAGANGRAPEDDLFQIDAAGFLVDMSSVLVDYSSDATPAASRPALQQALRRMSAGDTLVIARFGYLGNVLGDIASTLEAFSARGTRVICLESGDMDLAASGEASVLTVLRLAIEVGRNTKRCRAVDASAAARKGGVALGRPVSLSSAQRAQALDALAAGSTVTAVARLLDTSRQTIIRVRDAEQRGVAKTEDVALRAQ